MLPSKKNNEREVTIAVRMLKNCTAVVADGIIAEKLKYGLLLECLCCLLNKCEDYLINGRAALLFPYTK